MATTFLKRQKEMKRLEKQREKAERRAQKKLASRTQNEPPAENISKAAQIWSVGLRLVTDGARKAADLGSRLSSSR
jgi:hypothetical protein